MEKKLENARLLFNEETLNIIFITGNEYAEKHLTFAYSTPMYHQFLRLFSNDQILAKIRLLKSNNKKLDAIKLCKIAFNYDLKTAKHTVDFL